MLMCIFVVALKCLSVVHEFIYNLGALGDDKR